MSDRTDLLRQHRTALARVAKGPWTEEQEREHPRGRAGNPGQFRKKDEAPAARTPDLGPIAPSMPKKKRPAAVPVPPQTLPKPPEGKTVKDLIKTQPNHPLLKAMADRGDLHPRDGGHFLAPRPGTSYIEGDPRNDPEFEVVHNRREYLSLRYVGVTRAAIEEQRKRGASEETLAKMDAAYRQRKKDRADGIGGETQELYDRRVDPVTGKTTAYEPARAEIHEDILEALEAKAADVPKGGKCIVLAGPSGAGKSTFLRLHGQDALGIEFKPDPDNPGEQIPADYIVVNPDEFKTDLLKHMTDTDFERYPGLGPGELANLLHEESSDLAKRAVERMMSQGYNVILDVTLSNAQKSKEKYVDKYADRYTYTTVLVDGDLRNSLHNAGNRWKAPDKKTGERTFSGRFVPMAVVMSQKAKHPDAQASWGRPYRSSNAEAFEQFKDDERVDAALVYDPFAQDDSQALTRIKGGDAPSRKATRRSLWGMLRAEGRSDVKDTEITRVCQALKDGQISEDDAFHFLTEEVRYADPQHAVPHGAEGRYQHVLDGGPEDTPGGYDEVVRARDRGLLSREFFARVNKTLYERGVPVD